MQAIKNLQTLIKMHKLNVDTQRRVLAQKTAEADALGARITAQEQELEEEKQKASNTAEANILIGAYIKSALLRIADLQEERIAKEKEVAIEHEKLALMFEELKRYEIAHETAVEEEKQTADKKENQMYDEQAGQRHHKNAEG